MDLKLRKRPGFVYSHEPAVADDIGSKDCRKSSILTLRFHGSLSMQERFACFIVAMLPVDVERA